MTDHGSTSDIAVGLARVSMYETYRTDKPLADDVDVRALVVRGDGGVAVLAIADQCILWPSTCLRIRGKVAGALGVKPERVGIFCTQNHSAEFMDGDDDRLYADKIDQAFVDCAREAAAKARPVHVARVARHAPDLAICGRVPVEGLEKFTVYYGWRLDGARPDAGHIIKNALLGLGRGEPVQVRAHQVGDGSPGDFEVPPAPVPVPEPLPAPPADDDLLQGLFFRTPDGEPVGSVVRFPVHPVTANHLEMDWQSGDFPAYARRRLEAEFGGTAVYLTGPCGDQYPPVGRKSLECARDIGEQVADVGLTALADLPGSAWDTGGAAAAVSQEIVLHVRQDYPASVDAARLEQNALEARIKELAGGAAADGAVARLASIKKLSDRWEMLDYLTSGQIYRWTGMHAEQLPDRTLRHPLFGMRIGRTVIAGLSGEPFGAASARLRQETLGDDLVTVEKANGWTTYHPTTAEFTTGGHEPSAALFQPDSDQVLIQAVHKLVAALMPEGARR